MGKKVLILAVNPKDTNQLRLGEEVRDIEEGLKKLAKKREDFSISTQWAVTKRHLRRHVLEVNPNIIHFCGHGEGPSGIAFEDSDGNMELASSRGLAMFFSRYQSEMECIVLNACYSEQQALAISEFIDFVIGMEGTVDDFAAIEFAVSFYDALGNGKGYFEAFEYGCSALDLNDYHGATPVIINRKEGFIQKKDDQNQLSKYQSFPIEALSVKSDEDFVENNFPVEEVEPLFPRGDTLNPLPSIFKKYDDFVESLIFDLECNEPNGDSFELNILNSIKTIFEAKIVFKASSKRNDIVNTDGCWKKEEVKRIRDWILAEMPAIFGAMSPSQLCISSSIPGIDLKKSKFIVIPLDSSDNYCLFVFGSTLDFDDIYCRTNLKFNLEGNWFYREKRVEFFKGEDF